MGTHCSAQNAFASTFASKCCGSDSSQSISQSTVKKHKRRLQKNNQTKCNKNETTIACTSHKSLLNAANMDENDGEKLSEYNQSQQSNIEDKEFIHCIQNKDMKDYINKQCCKIITVKTKYDSLYFKNYQTDWILISGFSTNQFLVTFWSIIDKTTGCIVNQINEEFDKCMFRLPEPIEVIFEDKSFVISKWTSVEIDSFLRYMVVFNKDKSKFKIIPTKPMKIISMVLQRQFTKHKKQLFKYNIPTDHPTHNISFTSHNLCHKPLFANNGNNFVVILLISPNLLSFSIYNSYTNDVLQFEANVGNGFEGQYGKRLSKIKQNISILDDNSIAFLCRGGRKGGMEYYTSKYYLNANKKYETIKIEYSGPFGYESASLSNKYLFSFNYETQYCFIANIESNSDTLQILNKWQIMSKTDKDAWYNRMYLRGERYWEAEEPIKSVWYNDDIAILYFTGHLFVFMNAKINRVYSQLLFKWFGDLNNDLMNMILDNIGFKYYGCWLVNSEPINEDKRGRNFPPYRVLINAYFGLNKQYVVITKWIRMKICGEFPFMQIVVDLNKNDITNDSIQIIEI